MTIDVEAMRDLALSAMQRREAWIRSCADELRNRWPWLDRAELEKMATEHLDADPSAINGPGDAYAAHWLVGEWKQASE